MSTRDRLTLAAAVAVALASSALSPLYADLSWLPRVLGSVLVVAVVGLVSRRGGVPTLLVPLVQLLGLAVYTCLAFARETLSYAVLPTGRTVDVFQALVTAARKDILELAAPVPANPGLLLLATLGIGAVAVVVDLLAVGLRRAAIAGPAAARAVRHPVRRAARRSRLAALRARRRGLADPAARRERGEGRPLGAPAAHPGPGRDGGLEPRPGRPADRRGRARRRRSSSRRWSRAWTARSSRAAATAAVTATGKGRTTVTYNPITRLQGDLRQPRPTELLRYTTTDTDPDYLRMTTLDTFDGSSWRSSSLTGERVDRGIPTPSGVQAAVPTRELTTVIDVAPALDTRWLPVPANPTRVDVQGRWLWDPSSDTAFSTRSTTRRVGEYEVNATRVLPGPDLLRAADEVAEDVADYVKPVPVQDSVRRLTEDVTRGAPTAYEKARALQAFFRDRSNGFEYSVETGPRFDNPDALTAFLDRDTGRKGFCEQYASAMAVMLRVLGIPSRVAVGFTPGSVQSDLSRVVTTADAHAWPEAWFEGAGWIRFEPTPAGTRTVVPEYSTESADAPVGPRDPNTGAPTGPLLGDTANEAAGPSGKLDRIDPAVPVAPAAGPLVAEDDGLPSPWLLVPLLLLVGAITPSVVAFARRRARWRSPGPLAAWQQVEEDARDTGHRWRTSDSPRAAAARLAFSAGLAGQHLAALHRLAAAAERERYARPGSVPDVPGLRADAGTVRKALLAGIEPSTRVRAHLAPPSTLAWMAHTSGTLVADALDKVDDAVAGVSRRLHRRPA